MLLKKTAQASIEYIFMIALMLVVLVYILKKFLDPRVGELKKVGKISENTSSKINSTLDKLINRSD